jgi:A118 family predicted phage portal protein
MLDNKIRDKVYQVNNGTIENMGAYYNEWFQWYSGNVDNFHKFDMNVSGTMRPCYRKSLQVPKMVCEEMVKLVLSNNISITSINDEDNVDNLEEILRDNSFYESYYKFIEKVFLFGIGATITFLDSDEKVVIDFVDADKLVPLEFKNQHITSLATISQSCVIENEKKVYYNEVIKHYTKDGTYFIDKHYYKSENVNDLGDEYSLSDDEGNIQEFKEINMGENPTFQFYNLPNQNNININTPISVGLLANSIDTYKAIDEAYDSYSNEFTLGRKRIFIGHELVKASYSEGGDAKYFDVGDTTFQLMNSNSVDSIPIIESNMALRVTEHKEKLDDELRMESRKQGVGSSFLAFKDITGGNKTAEEVRFSQADTLLTKIKYQTYFKSKLKEMISSILGLKGLNIEFDIELGQELPETAKEKQMRLREDFSLGILSEQEYLRQAYGWSEEQIAKNVEEKQVTPNELDPIGFNAGE